MADYTLNTGKKYIKDIFDKEWFYNIPEYQRPYVWGKNQVEILLEDLTNAMDRDSKKEYFLGCMIWNTQQDQDSSKKVEYTYQDILDGQQRFITLYLLQGVLRDLSESEDLKQEVRGRLRQEENVYRGIPKRNRIEFIIRDDADFLEKYLLPDNSTLQVAELETVTKNREEGTSIRNMANAILVINNWWGKVKKDKGDEYQDYISNFYIYLSNKVLALYLATPDNLDDAYNLFTVLNSRGLQLQVSDILRAQNLRVIKDSELRKIYAERWSNYENSIDAPFKSFDEFLWAIVFIKMKYRSDDNQSLTKGFDFMYNRGLLSRGSETFDTIGKYIKHFETISSNGIVDKDTGYFFSNLIFILTTTFGNTFLPPLLHYKECFGEYRIVEFLLRLDNLCSASWLTGKRNLQSRLFMLLRRMDEHRKLYISVEEAADNLLDNEIMQYEYQDEKASTLINLDELFESFNTERWGSFSGSKINKTKYLLLKLDLLLSNFYTRIYYNKSQSSVEHLMPQKINIKDWEIDTDAHKVWLHRLGNIILVDRKKNSSLSNSSYKVKKEKYKGAIENRANTNWLFLTYQDWGTDEMFQNHERVLNLLKEYYQGNSIDTLMKMKLRLNRPDKTV